MDSVLCVVCVCGGREGNSSLTSLSPSHIHRPDVNREHYEVTYSLLGSSTCLNTG